MKRCNFVFLAMAISLLNCCRSPLVLLPSNRGPEDLAVLDLGRGKGLVTGTADKRFGKTPHGAIQLHDPASGEGFKTLLPDGEGFGPAFNPSGITVIPGDGSQWIYTANSPAPGMGLEGGSVEVFRYHEGNLTRHGSISLKPFSVRPNGIAVAADGSVYVSSINIIPGFGLVPEAVPPKGTRSRTSTKSSVYRFKPQAGSRLKGEWKKVADGINGANGLAITDDGSALLVCSYHENSILMFRRNPESGMLEGKPKRIICDLDFHPDNLKNLGGDRFSVCGQYSRAAFLLHSIFRARSCFGGAEEFTLHNGEVRSRTDLSHWIAGDGSAPSTCIRIGGTLYLAHVTSEGVSRVTPCSCPR